MLLHWSSQNRGERRVSWSQRGLLALLWVWVGLTLGCSTSTVRTTGSIRRFDFQRDTFNFTNELRWVYSVDRTTGSQTWTRRAEEPAYSLHCFVMVQRARQFYWHAQFDPTRPRGDEETERRGVRSVIQRSDFRSSPGRTPVTIPGYADLREFSRERGGLLQEECGGAWRSYVQRGHWRMVFPFSRTGQQRVAERLEARLLGGTPCAIHVVRFPSLKINHALLLLKVSRAGDSVIFHAYDPNTPARPIELNYSTQSRRFELPTTEYFAGGFVNVYEVYRNAIY